MNTGGFAGCLSSYAGIGSFSCDSALAEEFEIPKAFAGCFLKISLQTQYVLFSTVSA